MCIFNFGENHNIFIVKQNNNSIALSSRTSDHMGVHNRNVSLHKKIFEIRSKTEMMIENFRTLAPRTARDSLHNRITMFPSTFFANADSFNKAFKELSLTAFNFLPLKRVEFTTFVRSTLRNAIVCLCERTIRWF